MEKENAALVEMVGGSQQVFFKLPFSLFFSPFSILPVSYPPRRAQRCQKQGLEMDVVFSELTGVGSWGFTAVSRRAPGSHAL